MRPRESSPALRRVLPWALALLAAVPSRAPAASSPSQAPPRIDPADPEDLLREAFFAEVVQCDPEAARDLYRALLARPALPSRVAALAHLRLGICFHLLEDWAEAEAEFRTVLEDFPGEPDAAAAARQRLGKAPRDPARFMPPDVVVYCEVVEPGRQVGFLSDLIRGTPLENPVDYYLLSSPGPSGPEPDEGPPASAPQIDQMRAILNLNVLKELQKIEGFAIGATSLEKARPAWLLVFLPGSSELSRVLIKAVLPAVMDRTVPETLKGMRIFKLTKDSLHVAMDEGEEVLLLGATREIVVEAIRRGVPGGGDGAPPRSLSQLDDFRRAQAARAGSMLFVYADREKAIASLRAETPPKDLGAFDEVHRLLGLDQLRAVAATLARAGDDLRITLRSRIDPGRHPLWPILRTPPLGRGALSFVPANSLGFFASAASEGEKRWTQLRSALAPIVAGLPETSGGKEARAILEFLDSGLEMDFGRDFLGELRGFTVGVPARIRFPAELSFFLVLEFRDGDAAQPRVEKLIALLMRRAFGKETPVEFQDQAPRGAVRLRSCEPRPGFKVLYAREGSTFVLSPLLAVALDLLDARSTGTSADRALLPALASKALVLAPRAIRELQGSREAPRSEGEAFISHLNQAIFFTEEAPDGIAIELRIPGVTQALRETLKEMPIRRPAAEGEAGKK